MPIVSIVEENGDVTTYNVEENQVIFDALQDQDRELPHGCLSGSCSACKCEIIEGAENLNEIGSIEKNTLEHILKTKPEAQGKTIRLTCRAKILGDIKIRHLDYSK